MSLPPLLSLARPLDNALVEQTDASVLVDTVHPGEVLCISFGFVNWERRPDFDFFGRLKKLEAASGTPINKVLIRDVGNSWYQRGLPGLGDDIAEVTQSLRQLIRGIAPKTIVLMGQSMGAYGAIMFGALLDVDAILAFGPLSFFDPVSAVAFHDRRWLSVMLALDKDPPRVVHRDLAALCRTQGTKPDLRVFFGTKPDVGGTESTNLDVLHAMRFAALPNCRIRAYPTSGHTVVQHLIDTGQIDGLLAQHVLGLEADGPILTDDWVSWLTENLRLGADLEDLVGTLVKHGQDDALARRTLDALINAQAGIGDLS